MEKSRLVKYHHSRIEIHTVFIYSILFTPLSFGTFFFHLATTGYCSTGLKHCPDPRGEHFLARLSLPWGFYACSGWVWCKPLVTYLTNPKVTPSKTKTFTLVNEHGWLDSLLCVEQGVLSSLLLLCWFIVTICLQERIALLALMKPLLFFLFWGGNWVTGYDPWKFWTCSTLNTEARLKGGCCISLSWSLSSRLLDWLAT